MDTLIGCFLPDKQQEEMTDKTTETTKNRRTFDPAFKLQAARTDDMARMVMNCATSRTNYGAVY